MRCRLADRHEYRRTGTEDTKISTITFSAYPTYENLQAVTNTSFATYLVNYVAKVEPTGKAANPLDSVDDSQLLMMARHRVGCSPSTRDSCQTSGDEK